MSLTDIAFGDPFIPFALLAVFAIAAAIVRELWWKPRQHSKSDARYRAEVTEIGRHLAEQRRGRIHESAVTRKGRAS